MMKSPLAELAIKRPIFITCIVILIIVVGLLSFARIPVNLFPNVSFPYIIVQTIYPGAGPKEIEQNISKVVEEELSGLVGLKTLRSVSREGVSAVICEFNMSVDVKYAEQQVRDKLSNIRSKIPDDAKNPIIRRLDPADLPIVQLSLVTNIPENKIFDLADEVIKVKLEQVSDVALVEVLGAREREIRVELNREKLKDHEVSVGQVVNRLQLAGSNIPAGKIDVSAKQENIFRTLGEYTNIQDIAKSVVSFYGNDVPVTIADIGKVVDGLETETTKSYVNGQSAVLLNVYKQTGTNTMSVVQSVFKAVEKINQQLAESGINGKLLIVRDGSKEIQANVTDVKESIIIGIILTILVVYLFLRNTRSTFITGMALPNSLLGAFILIIWAGFSINVMTLLALSLAVGLLIDDAIVVRENIFRHLEMGKDPKTASIEGTSEVTLAVLGTTLTVLAVFGPIAFLDGVVGQFFKEFGLTICFAMIISTFDALTIAPMLSTYLAKRNEHHAENSNEVVSKKKSSKFMNFLVELYQRILNFSLERPLVVIVAAFGIFIFSLYCMKWVPKTFLPPQDVGEFTVSLEMKPGTSLSEMNRLALLVDQKIRTHTEVATTLLTVGEKDGSPNKATFYVSLVPAHERNINTILFKDIIRADLLPFAEAKPLVRDYDPIGGGDRPFSLVIAGDDELQLTAISQKVYEKLKNNPALSDVEISLKPGRPETQIVPDKFKAEKFGVTEMMIGTELRAMMEGVDSAIYRSGDHEYNVKVRLQDDQRNLAENFSKMYVPNINYSLVALSSIASIKEATSGANILRQDRNRYVLIGAEVTAKGKGMGGAINEVNRIFKEEIKLPPGMSYHFFGQAENFQDLAANMIKALILAILFIYLVLASLYESFVTPLTIMLVIPLAVCGALFALLLTQHSLDLFSMIGCIMLLGVATKNSIILVDYANQLVQQGMDFKAAIFTAGMKRIRPILMTSFALIAGMLPIAYGLNEASKQRMSMGIAVIGGIISSTILTLVVIPASYSYIERFRRYSLTKMKRLME